MNVGIIGCGAWGATFAQHMASRGHSVIVHDLDTSKVKALLRLPNIAAAPTLPSLISKASVLVLAIPSGAIRTTLTPFVPQLCSKRILNLSKGFDHKNLQTISMLFFEFGGRPLVRRFALLSGPSFATEVAQRRPTAVTIASSHLKTAKFFQHLVSSDTLRAYTSRDVIGVEIAGALKNVIAIATGICDGLRLGHNARAALITRGLSEITQLGLRLGANPLTFLGLAGLGDLVLTCCGDLSRNRRLGLAMAKGISLEDALATIGEVVEGVDSTRTALRLARTLKIEMPITREVYNILFRCASPQKSLARLMTRALKKEIAG